MARRANQTFVTWVGGAGPQWFQRGDVVPARVTDNVLALTYDDGADTPAPKKRAAKKAAAKSDD